MNTSQKIIYFILIGYLCSCGITIPRQQKTVLREVMVTTEDTIIIAKVIAGKVRIKPDPEKEYYWYMIDEIHSNFGGYTGNLLHGEYRKFDAKRNLLEKGRFEEGLKAGNWMYWNNKGELIENVKFRNGKKISSNGDLDMEKSETKVKKDTVNDNPNIFKRFFTIAE